MKSLTDYADCAGCASKFQAADLDLILEGLPRAHVDVNLEFHLDKAKGRDEPFKVFLAQLHMFL